jgi:hypothetical protein
MTSELVFEMVGSSPTMTQSKDLGSALLRSLSGMTMWLLDSPQAGPAASAFSIWLILCFIIAM